jgi:hypothetical protein
LESPLEQWVRAFLGSLRKHGADRFDDLPENVKAGLHEMAGHVWPAWGRIREEVGDSLRALPNAEDLDSLGEGGMLAIAQQLLPELTTSDEEKVEIAHYGLAIRMVDQLWRIGRP